MAFTKFSSIKSKVANEGLDYFITSYASPSHIPKTADAKCLQFKNLWLKVLPLLQEMNSLLDEEDDEDGEDGEEETE